MLGHITKKLTGAPRSCCSKINNYPIQPIIMLGQLSIHTEKNNKQKITLGLGEKKRGATPLNYLDVYF